MAHVAVSTNLLMTRATNEGVCIAVRDDDGELLGVLNGEKETEADLTIFPQGEDARSVNVVSESLLGGLFLSVLVQEIRKS